MNQGPSLFPPFTNIIKQKELYLVLSEPGDATRYHYAVRKTGSWYFFEALTGTVSYPECINISVCEQHQNVLDDFHFFSAEFVALAKQLITNPYTLQNCMLSAQRIHKEVKDGKVEEQNNKETN